MGMDPKKIDAAVTQIDNAAADWMRLAASCQRSGDLEGKTLFEGHAAEAERLAEGLIKLGPTDRGETVCRNVARRMVALEAAENRFKLSKTASTMKGTEQGLRAMLTLFAWSDEEADSAYKKMRQKRPIADSLTASRGTPAAPAAPSAATAERQARIARQRRMSAQAGAAASAGNGGGRWDDLLR